MNFLSVRGGQGLSKGRRGLGERGGWWLEVWNKGAGAWGGSLRAWGAGAWRGPSGWGPGGAGPSGEQSDGRLFARSLGRMYGKFTPLCYRTSSPSGPLPKREKRKRKGDKERDEYKQKQGPEANDASLG